MVIKYQKTIDKYLCLRYILVIKYQYTQKEKDMYIKTIPVIRKQLTFGLLALRCMFDEDVLESSLQENDIQKVKEKLKAIVSEEYDEMLDFILEELFSLEDGTERIREVYADIDSIYEDSFAESYRYSAPGMQDDYTNGSIEALAASIFATERPSTVMDLCSGQGVFLTAASRCSADAYHGIEINKDYAMISKLKFLITGYDHKAIRIDDVFNPNLYSGNVEKYDAVFCHMPMGMPLDIDKVVKTGLLDEYQAMKVSKRESEWAYIKAMEKMINKPRRGMGIALVRSSLLFSEIGKVFRRDLIKRGLLEGIILLPPNMLNTTGVQTALIIIRSNNDTVNMVDATGFAVSGRRTNSFSKETIKEILNLYYTGRGYSDMPVLSTRSIKVTTKEIADNGYSFEPTRYILKKQLQYINEVKLSDFTTKIFRGVQIKADDHDAMSEFNDAEPNCYLLNLSDISNGYINDDLEKVHVDNLKKYQRYMLHPQDVIISARGTKISVAVADSSEKRDIIVTGNLIAIRCGEELDPYFLKALFESNDGIAMLKAIQTGGNIFAINPRQLQEMPIELMDREKQQKIREKTEWLVGELKGNNQRNAIIKEQLAHLVDEFKEV